MAGKSFQFTLTTPQGKVLNVQAASVILPAHDGQLGVLPGRAPMVVKLGVGALQVDVADSAAGQGGRRAYLVEEGFAHMIGDKLTILTPRATAGETLTEAGAKAELAKVESAKPVDKLGKERHAKDLVRARAAVRMVTAGRGGI